MVISDEELERMEAQLRALDGIAGMLYDEPKAKD